MVNKYPIVKQEKESWSLPACLQSIIKLRRVYEPSQREIAEGLGILDNLKGNLCERIGEFLEKYNLRCRYENPFTNVRGDELLLEGELNENTDVIAAYDWNRVHSRKGNPKKQFSIVVCYDPSGKGRMVVRDSLGSDDLRIDAVCLHKFRSAVNPAEDSEYGFYMID